MDEYSSKVRGDPPPKPLPQLVQVVSEHADPFWRVYCDRKGCRWSSRDLKFGAPTRRCIASRCITCSARGMRRDPPVEAAQAREAPALAAFNTAVEARAGGMCEAPWYVVIEKGMAARVIDVPHTCSQAFARHPGISAHHVWPEDRDCGRHDPDRGLWICRAAHRWAHDNPADAKLVGILRPEGEPEDG